MSADKIIGKTFTSIGVKDAAKAKKIFYISSIAIGGVIVLTIALKIRKAAKDRAEAKDAKRYDPSEMSGEISDINVTSRNLTISDGDAILISQNLLSAMDKWGTDEKVIYDSLNSLQTKDDLLLVMQKFGVKPYSGTGLAESWFTRTGFKNLNGWLRAELSKSEQTKVKAIYDRLGVPF